MSKRHWRKGLPSALITAGALLLVGAAVAFATVDGRMQPPGHQASGGDRQECDWGHYGRRADSVASLQLFKIGRAMEELAQLAHYTYVRGLGFQFGDYEGPIGRFHVGAEQVLAAAVELNPRHLPSRLLLATLTWQVASLGEGRIDLAKAEVARRRAECARVLGREVSDSSVVAQADSLISVIDFYLEEERRR